MSPSANSRVKLRTLATDGVTILSIVMSTSGLAIALAALVFTGASAESLPRAITSFILGGAIVGLILGLKSRFNTLIAGTQDSVAVVLIAVTAAVAASASNDPATATVVLMGISCVITGTAMWLVGQLGIGAVIRSLPTTVVAGFVAGTGWLLLVGGFSVMLNQSIGLANLEILVQADSWHYWLPGLSLALIILLSSSSRRLPPFTTSLVIFIAVATFFVIALNLTTIGDIERNQWLIGPFPESTGIQFITLTELAQFPWHTFLHDLPIMLPVILVSCIGVLLNLSGLEFIFNKRVDLDTELKSSGIANIIISPLGGMVGYHLMGSSTLAKQLGARTKLIPVGVGVVSILIAVFGGDLIGYLPRFVVGGILAASGLGLIKSWVRDQLPAFFRLDRYLSIIIFAVIALLGILEGIAVGVAIASVIFIVQYSRINPVRFVSSGVDLRSRVDRPVHIIEALIKSGDRRVIFELQGYLFFGSTTMIANQINDRLDGEHTPETIIIDCSMVTGIDISGFSVLRQIADDLEQRNIALLLTGLRTDIKVSLDKAQPSLRKRSLLMDTLDHALEQSENDYLATSIHVDDAETTTPPTPPHQRLSHSLLAFFDIMEVDAGNTLIEQNKQSDTLYIVKEGTGIAFHVKENGEAYRIRQFGPDTLLGEIGFLQQGTSTATVVADTPMILYCMAREQFQALRQTDIALAIEFQDYLLQSTAIRLSSISEHFARTLR